MKVYERANRPGALGAYGICLLTALLAAACGKVDRPRVSTEPAGQGATGGQDPAPRPVAGGAGPGNPAPAPDAQPAPNGKLVFLGALPSAPDTLDRPAFSAAPIGRAVEAEDGSLRIEEPLAAPKNTRLYLVWAFSGESEVPEIRMNGISPRWDASARRYYVALEQVIPAPPVPARDGQEERARLQFRLAGGEAHQLDVSLRYYRSRLDVAREDLDPTWHSDNATATWTEAHGPGLLAKRERLVNRGVRPVEVRVRHQGSVHTMWVSQFQTPGAGVDLGIKFETLADTAVSGLEVTRSSGAQEALRAPPGAFAGFRLEPGETVTLAWRAKPGPSPGREKCPSQFEANSCFFNGTREIRVSEAFVPEAERVTEALPSESLFQSTTGPLPFREKAVAGAYQPNHDRLPSCDGF